MGHVAKILSSPFNPPIKYTISGSRDEGMPKVPKRDCIRLWGFRA